MATGLTLTIPELPSGRLQRSSGRRTEAELTQKFRDTLKVNPDLDRRLVSFQANKAEIEHRWYKYREGFSASVVRYILSRVGPRSGQLLDPFAGSGTTLFAASEIGIDAVGIELLPIGTEIIEVRRLLLAANRQTLAEQIREFGDKRSWEKEGSSKPFRHLRITTDAFPKESEHRLGRYLDEVERLQNRALARILRFAALCILEDISYTRKDGQYLRWDARSGRRGRANKFSKGKIFTFTQAIAAKLREISNDLLGAGLPFENKGYANSQGQIQLLNGSCLDVLSTLQSSSFDGIITSPPYCNRYDYTRTYALELAMLGVGEAGISGLRQAMMACTVENREKSRLAEKFSPRLFTRAMSAVQTQPLLSELLDYLETCRVDGSLNNNGIPRMVRNYFLELSLVIFECARVLKRGAPFVMVNDNVQYQGAHIPVDLILSDVAERAGLEVRAIWVLPKGKGNSSQQMGEHGRRELRKCIYVWTKPGRDHAPR